MSMRHTVKSGDSLWGLAHRYQGSGTQWPEIVEHHNKEVARYGPHSALLPIRDPNLIFIGQTLFLPPRVRHTQQGSGDKNKANRIATPVDLKVKYSIGHDTHRRFGAATPMNSTSKLN